MFFSRVKRVIGEPAFMDDEIEDGFKLLWIDPNEALSMVQGNRNASYGGKFVVLRDGLIISEYLEMLIL